MTRKEEIEQAAEEYSKSMSWRWEAPNYPHKEAFIAGANWQKEQMMKTAFDAEVGYWNIRGLSINMKLPKYIEDGDKVKVIIVKEE